MLINMVPNQVFSKKLNIQLYTFLSIGDIFIIKHKKLSLICLHYGFMNSSSKNYIHSA